MRVFFSYYAVLGALLGAVEQESAEDGNPHAITQHSQVHVSKLEGCRVLVHHLPHAVQEEQKERTLKGRREREEGRIYFMNILLGKRPRGLYLSNLDRFLWRGLMFWAYFLLVVPLQVVAPVEEAMAGHHPLLLHQALEACQAPEVRVQHHLHQ